MDSTDLIKQSPSYDLLVNSLIEMGPLSWQTRHNWRDQLAYKNFDCSKYTTEDFKQIIENDLSGEFEDETNWAVPIHVRRIISVQKRTDLIDVLILRLISNDIEDDWAHEELPEILAEFGPVAISFLAKEFEGSLWADQAFEYASISTALKMIAESHPNEKDRICSILRKALSEFELNPPTLNSFLASDLVDLNDRESAPIIYDLYAKKFLDQETMSWNEVYKAFGDINGISEKIIPTKYNVNDFSYSGDDRFERMLKSLGSHYNTDEIKCLIVGSILSIEMIQPSAIIDDLFYNIEGDEIYFVSEGQAALFYKELFGLWNELTKYQSEVFVLPQVRSGNRVYRRRMQLLSFVEGFTKDQEGSRFMKEFWVDEFLEPLQIFLDATEEFAFITDEENLIEVTTLLESTELYWSNNYLKFAQSCNSERKNLIETRQFLETHKSVGRNEPCPCGSGTKFKKCCLNLGSLH